MKKTCSRLLLGIIFMTCCTHAYDLKTIELTPVNFMGTPDHKPVEMIRNGQLKFTIVADLQAEKRMKGKNHAPYMSIGPAITILQEAIRHCTGQKPVVMDVKDAPQTGNMIVVGDCSIARDHHVKAMDMPLQSFMITTFNRGIILAGNDSSLVEGYNMRPLEKLGASTGTKYAAYDFVERFLGVRYYFPGDYGTLWPTVKELTIRPTCYVDAPYFDTRNGKYFINLTLSNKEHAKYWEPYLGKMPRRTALSFWERWRLGFTKPISGDHCPQPKELAKSYPDHLKTIFYTSPTGNFWYNSKAHGGNYYDVLNFDFAELLLKAYKKFYASDGKIDEGRFNRICNLSNVSFGVCDTYMSELDIINHPLVRQLGLITPEDLQRGSRGYSGNIYARFHQYLGRRLQEELPGKKLYIMAYCNASNAGTDPRWQLPPNVEVKVCTAELPNKIHNPRMRAKVHKRIREWYVSQGFRPIKQLWVYTGQCPFILAINGELVGEIPQFLGRYLGRVQLFYDHCSDGWTEWFHYPSFYAAYRSMWNPEWDAARAIDAHWDAFYGKECGRHLRQFHRLLRECYQKYGEEVDNPLGGVLYPDHELKKMEKLMAAARKAAKPGTVEEKRLNLILAPWPKAIESMRNQLSYERPVYGVHQLLPAEAVILDGKSEEPVWSKIEPMKMISPKGYSAPPKYPVSIKLAWNKMGLYGLFQTTYSPVADPQNDIWVNDSYEIFLMPGVKMEAYYQLVFDAIKNIRWCMQRNLPIPQPFDYHWKAPGFQIASSVDAKSWTAEIFIPYRVLETVAPQPYDCWYANLVRNKMGKNRERSGTSMTLGNNHNYAMYGILKFLGKGE